MTNYMAQFMQSLSLNLGTAFTDSTHLHTSVAVSLLFVGYVFIHVDEPFALLHSFALYGSVAAVVLTVVAAAGGVFASTRWGAGRRGDAPPTLSFTVLQWNILA